MAMHVVISLPQLSISGASQVNNKLFCHLEAAPELHCNNLKEISRCNLGLLINLFMETQLTSLCSAPITSLLGETWWRVASWVLTVLHPFLPPDLTCHGVLSHCSRGLLS